ncbi:MAG: hypothetical protein HUU46_10490 [Candidatus Hydrogenedentes bacterium]|nr:hypothetical protein [Candidatus Hydrogenedentota bacterium]
MGTARELHVGDSRETVIRTLGEPTIRCEKDWQMISRDVNTLTEKDMNLAGAIFWGERPEIWGYGKMFGPIEEWFVTFPPYLYPFKLRLFGPDPEDIQIVFDENELVSSVQIPEE